MASRFCVVVAILVVCLGAVGCTQHVGSLALVSVKTPQYERMAAAPIVKNVEAEVSRTWFLFIPFGGRPTFEEAIDQAIKNGNGDFMVNARFYSNDWTFLLFSYGSCKVVGDVGNSRGAATLTVPSK